MEQIEVRPDGLQFCDQRNIQERIWKAERLGWIVFCLIIVAACAGFTGARGLLAHATASTAAAVIDYPRYTRWSVRDSLHIQFPHADAGVETRQVILSPSFQKAFRIETIQPSPTSSRATGKGLVLDFDVEGASVTGVEIDIATRQPGLSHYGITVDHGEPLRLSTLILP